MSQAFHLSAEPLRKGPNPNPPPGAPTDLLPPNEGIGPVPKYPFPDFATQDDSAVEVKAPSDFTQDETLVIRSIPELSTQRLTDLLRIYERMGNLAMMQTLSRAVLERVPDHPDAMRIAGDLDSNLEVRKPDYLEEVTAKLLAGEPSTDPDAVASQVRWLISQRRIEEAILVLEKLRSLNYKDQRFPYLEELAFCYFDQHRWNDAEKAFTGVTKDERFDELIRRRAEQQLDLIEVEKRIVAARARATTDPAVGLDVSSSMLAELPEHPSVIAFRIECLQYAGKTQEALELLKKLKSSTSTLPAFPYQRLLGHTYLDMKNWDKARETFVDIEDNPIFDNEARSDASQGAEMSAVCRKGELAIAAANRGEFEDAMNRIVEMEKDYPRNIQVLGYRAAVLARTGARNEALQLLDEKKSQIAKGDAPFVLQDTVADVYLEAKEFDSARASYQEILDNPKYDWSMRRRAFDGIPMVRKAEILEEGYVALRDRHPSGARKAAAKLEEEPGPKTIELDLLRAETKLSEGHPSQAKTELESLKEKTPDDQLFQAQGSLGTAYLRTGAWKNAYDAYSELLDHELAYTPYERMQARWERREAIPLTKQTASAGVAYRHESEGSVFRAATEYASGWLGDWRMIPFARLDVVYLDDKPADLPGRFPGERYEGGLRVQRKFGPGYAVEGMAGGSRDDVIYGARFGKFLNPGLAWALSFLGNARSTESITLEAMDGREDRVEFQFGGPLPGPWNFAFNAYAKRIDIDDDRLGDGYGGSALVEYVVKTQTEKRPEIAIGYFGEYQHFSYASEQEAVFGSLVDKERNRHGVQATVRRNLNDSASITAGAGVFYAFDQSSVEYTGSVGMHYYVTDDALLFAELRYESIGKGSSAGSGAWEASLGTSVSF